MIQRNRLPGGRVVSAISLMALSILGCSKVTSENYDKLKIGMDYQEVVALLGEPEQCEAVLAAKSCTWGKEPRTIKIQLMADKVVLFSSEGL